jgi:hypothetical protein
MHRTDRGAAVLMVTMGVTVGVALVIGGLILKRDTYISEQTRLRLATQGLAAMETVGQQVQRAYDLGGMPGPCPAGTVPRMVAGRRFCWPAPGASPVCVENGLCVDAANITARIEENGEWLIEGELTNPWRYEWREMVAEFNRRIQSVAWAQRISHLPPAPAIGTTDNAIRVPVCPGDPLCQSCGGGAPTLACIRMRICPRTSCTILGHFWYQRYGLRL